MLVIVQGKGRTMWIKKSRAKGQLGLRAKEGCDVGRFVLALTNKSSSAAWVRVPETASVPAARHRLND